MGIFSSNLHLSLEAQRLHLLKRIWLKMDRQIHQDLRDLIIDQNQTATMFSILPRRLINKHHPQLVRDLFIMYPEIWTSN